MDVYLLQVVSDSAEGRAVIGSGIMNSISFISMSPDPEQGGDFCLFGLFS